MRLGLLTTTAVLASLASGCAVAPGGPVDGSVTHDVVDYLHREWPLAGPPAIPADACPGGCACCGGGAAQAAPCGPSVYSDDWDQPGVLPTARGYTDDPPPAAPLDPPPAGRFFPVPARPPFAPPATHGAPQAPSVAGFGPIAKADG